MKCDACGVIKNMKKKEIFPCGEEYGIVGDVPIVPILELDCQSTKKLKGNRKEFRRANVCHKCFHTLQPEMWILQKDWESIDPMVPFEDLPKL